MTTQASPAQIGAGKTHALLAELAAIRDPEGVLSVYAASSAPTGERHEPHAEDIAVRGALDALLKEVEESGPRAKASALRSTIERLRSPLADLTDPTAGGLGRALFARLSGGDHRVIVTRDPVDALVMLGPAAALRPLLGPLDAGRPMGVVAVSGDRVRAVSLDDGSAEDVLALEFDDQSGEWRRLQGPASSNPAQAMQTASQRDLFERRFKEHRRRFVSGAADALVAMSGERGWERIGIAGSAEFTRALAEATEGRVETVPCGFTPRHELSAGELARQFQPHLSAARERRHTVLVDEVRNAALAARGTAALGPDDVFTALAEGRVHQLLLDTRREMTGSVAPDGRLVRAGQKPPGVEVGELTSEPHLVERMIERTLAAGGDIVPLVPAAADGLSEWDGVAAFLRW
jgi:Bacterial archaeo-eukaryotic release factor family 5